MSKKDIVAEGKFMPTEVGRHIYVWSRGGRKPAPRERDCAISSHGVQSLINRKIKGSKPNNFVFYCPHGYNLQDPGILPVVRGVTKPNKIVPVASAGQDYVLTKFQGYHGSQNRPETYGFIQRDMFPEVQREGARLELEEQKREAQKYLTKFGQQAYQTKLEDAERDYQKILNDIQDVNMDVVTVRNRIVSLRDVTLFRIVEELEAHGFKYRDIHCVFCRGYAQGKSENWSPRDN